jgi:hypothetical protein
MMEGVGGVVDRWMGIHILESSFTPYTEIAQYCACQVNQIHIPRSSHLYPNPAASLSFYSSKHAASILQAKFQTSQPCLGRKSSWNGRTTVLRVCFLLFVDQTLRRLCGLSIDLSRRYPFTPTLLLATCFTIHVIGGASLIVERLVSFERK